MSHAILRMPSTDISVWDSQMADKIRNRVAAHATGREAEALITLCIQTKIDGNAAKLARLADMDPSSWKLSLRAAMDLLTRDSTFNRLFHLIRSAL